MATGSEDCTVNLFKTVREHKDEATAAERERCVKICDEVAQQLVLASCDPSAARLCAEKIRGSHDAR